MSVKWGFQRSKINTTRVLAAAIPGFVLVGVVEDHRPALGPGVNLAADLEGTILRDDERQMSDHPRIGNASMRK